MYEEYNFNIWNFFQDPNDGKFIIKYIIFTSLFDRTTVVVEDNRSFEESHEESNIENSESHSLKDDEGEAIIWIEKTEDKWFINDTQIQ